MVANRQLESPKSVIEPKFEVGDIEFHEIFIVMENLKGPKLCKGSVGPEMKDSVQPIFPKNSSRKGTSRRRILLDLVAFLDYHVRWDYCSLSLSRTSDNVASKLLCLADSAPSQGDSCCKFSRSVGAIYPDSDLLKVSAIKAISPELSLSLNRELSSISCSRSMSRTVSDPNSGSVANPPELEALPWRCLGVWARVRVLNCLVLEEAVAGDFSMAPIATSCTAKQVMLIASSVKTRSNR